MSRQDYIQLTLFPEDSPASHSVLPGSSEARMMTVTSGRSLSESYMSCSPIGSLVRMCLESSIWHSTRCLLTWKKKVTKSNVSLFQLAVSMPRTDGTESSLWPTPRVGGSRGSSPAGKKHVDLAAVVGGQLNPEWVEWLMGYEEQFTKLIPTPTATDYKGGCLSRYWRPDSQTVQVEREREREPGVRRPSQEPGRSFAVGEIWPNEPGVGRVAHGVPNRVDRLKCLGNAVVPQQFFPVFDAIARIERMTDDE